MNKFFAAPRKVKVLARRMILLNLLYLQSLIEMRRQLRDFRSVLSIFLFPTIYLIASITINRSVMQQLGRDWIHYAVVYATSLSVLSIGLMDFPTRFHYDRSKNWNRMLQVTPLARSIYLLAKIVTQLLLQACAIILVFLIAALFFHVVFSLTKDLLLMLWLLFSELTFLAIGLCIGMAGSATNFISFLVFMGLLLISGMLATIHGIPTWLEHAMPTYSLLQNAMAIIHHPFFSLQATGMMLLYAIIFIVFAVFLDQRKKIDTRG